MKDNRKIGGLWNSASRFIGTCPSDHIIADKRVRYVSPKLPSATSFILKTLYEMGIFENFYFSDASLKLMGKFCLATGKFCQKKEIGGERILFFLPASPKKGEAGSERR
jgi:hypothetical protein